MAHLTLAWAPRSPPVFAQGPPVGCRRAWAVAKRPLTLVTATREEELISTANLVAAPGKGILAIDEGTVTCGKRLSQVGLENTLENRRVYRELLITTPGLGRYISGAILSEETLTQETADGRRMTDVLIAQGIVPGVKVDKGLHPLPGSNNELWTAGLDGLEERCREYHAAGARFAKWRGVVSVPAGPSELAVRECAWGLARYAAAAQAAGLVPVVEPEVLTDGAHGLRAAVTTAERVWAAVFSALADCGVVLEGTLLKPSMVLPGAECPAGGAEPEAVAEATLAVLRRRVPPAVPGILFLSGGQQETEATANLQAMNERGPHPWRLSFSFARALQASVLRAWKGKPENAAAAQRALLIRAAANSAAQRGLYHPAFEGETAEATDSLYEQQYTY